MTLSSHIKKRNKICSSYCLLQLYSSLCFLQETTLAHPQYPQKPSHCQTKHCVSFFVLLPRPSIATYSRLGLRDMMTKPCFLEQLVGKRLEDTSHIKRPTGVQRHYGLLIMKTSFQNMKTFIVWMLVSVSEDCLLVSRYLRIKKKITQKLY